MRTRLVAAVLIGALVLWGAGSAPLDARAADKPITIGLAMPAVATAFWVSMAYGVQDEAKKLGVQLVMVDAGGFDQSSKQIQQILDLAQRRVDVLLVGATNAQAIGPVVDQVAAQGIPVIGLSSLPASQKLAAVIGADHYGMGALDATCLGKLLRGVGEVAVMAGPPGVNWAEERDRGFLETLKKEYPQIQIVAQQLGPSERNQGLKLMEDWLQRFPRLAGVFAATDDLGSGAADALASAGKTGQIKIATANLSQVGKAYLQAGKLDCQAAQQVVLQGRVAVQTAIKIAKHETYEKVFKTNAIGVTREALKTMDLSQIEAPADYRPR